MRDELAPLGWDDEWEGAFAPHAEAGRTPARVGRVDRGRVEALTGTTDDDAQLTHVQALVRLGPHATAEDQPTTGDWVALEVRDDGTVVTDVLPRRTCIVRGSAGKTSAGQLLAANVDTVLIAVPLEREAKLNMVERFVTVAWESGAVPLVVLTKADLSEDPEAEQLRLTEAAPGAQVLTVSAETGEGLDVLRAALGTTTALLGQSGAGKSTLANALAGREVMPTQQTRQDGKGRHTTTIREVVVLPGGGVLVDTPGLRGIGVHEASEGLARSFADVEALAEQCRFTDCAHETEPGCAVQQAIDDGQLTDRRLGSYRKQQREVEHALIRNDPLAKAALRRRWAAATKAGKAQAELKRSGRPRG